MGFVQRKATSALSKHSDDDFERMKTQFLDDVVATVIMEAIPSEFNTKLGPDGHQNSTVKPILSGPPNYGHLHLPGICAVCILGQIFPVKYGVNIVKEKTQCTCTLF